MCPLLLPAFLRIGQISCLRDIPLPHPDGRLPSSISSCLYLAPLCQERPYSLPGNGCPAPCSATGGYVHFPCPCIGPPHTPPQVLLAHMNLDMFFYPFLSFIVCQARPFWNIHLSHNAQVYFHIQPAFMQNGTIRHQNLHSINSAHNLACPKKNTGNWVIKYIVK